MSRGLDFEKATAALKRAAEKATYGTREERSGRFHATAPTRKQTIEKAKKLDPKAAVIVERVRSSSVGHRDKWRKP